MPWNPEDLRRWKSLGQVFQTGVGSFSPLHGIIFVGDSIVFTELVR